MAKVVDITDKLSFEERPKLKVKNNVFEVNADAATVLKIMQIIGDGETTTKDVVAMYELIFDESTRKKIEKLNLMVKDFQTLVMAAINLVTGSEDDLGE